MTYSPWFASRDLDCIEFPDGCKAWLYCEANAGHQEALERYLEATNTDDQAANLKMVHLMVAYLEDPDGKQHSPSFEDIRRLNRDKILQLVGEAASRFRPLAEISLTPTSGKPSTTSKASVKQSPSS